MKYKPTPPKLLDFIRSYDSFFVVSHIEPDGDCICSSLALCHFLTRIGKTAYPINQGPFERKEIAEYSELFIPRITQKLRKREPNSGVIVLDCSTLDRIGDVGKDLAGLEISVIDHHTSGEVFGDIRFINPTSPATSLLVQQVIEDLGYQPDGEESELIFFAFATDTGFFRHIDKDSALSFEYISRLVAAGASPKSMYHRITGGKSLASKKHLGLLLQKAESVAEGKAVIVLETKEETAEYGRENRDSDAFYQHMLSVQGVEAVIILRENSDGAITGGLRSKGYLDVGELAATFGGGGHQRAAGFSVTAELSEVYDQILQSLIPALKEEPPLKHHQ
jgi:phosphoesterase RecJ-like protein